MFDNFSCFFLIFYFFYAIIYGEIKYLSKNGDKLF